MKKLFPIPVVLLALLTSNVRADFTAYNDCAGISAGNLTTYQVTTGIGATTTGFLKDFSTGLTLGVTCSATSGGGVTYYACTECGASPYAAGTDAANTFGGIIDQNGSPELNADTDWYQYDFSGLDPSKNYEFVATMNRGNNTYTTRNSKYILSGAVSFVNSSSAGATKATTTVANDTAIFCVGWNANNGYVARWTEIKPSAGGTFSVRVYRSNAGVKSYGFGMFKLVETTPNTTDPTVTLGLNGSPMAEAGGVATVTATLSKVHTLPVTVNLAFSGTATLNTDYTPSASSIVIPAGSLSGSMTLTAVQDTLFEVPNETVVVDIATVVNGVESGIQQVTATITDDDPEPPGIRFDSASSASAGAVSTISWSHTVGSGNNRMLVVAVQTESNTDQETASVTFGAQSMIKVPGSRASQSSPFNVTELWYLPAPAVGTGTITITLAGALSNGAECGAVSLFGVLQSGPEAVAIANNAGTGSSYSLTITTLTDGAWLIDAVNNGTGGANFTPGTGMVERWDRTAGGQMAGAGATREIATAGTVTDTWTTTGTSRKAQSIAAFAPAPTVLNITVVTPARNQKFAVNTPITATAAVSLGTPPYTVTFYTNSASMGAAFVQAGAPITGTSPFSLPLGSFEAGNYNIYATVSDSVLGTATSATNAFIVSRLRYWDTATAAGLQAGPGTWDTDASWSTDLAGSDPLSSWAADSEAYFQTLGVNAVTISGTVQARLLNVSGSGTVLNLSGGTLALGPDGMTISGGQNSHTVASAVTLAASQAWHLTNGIAITGAIDGAGTLTKDGAGALTLSGNNTHNAGTILAEGALNLNSPGALGNGPLTIAGGSLNNTASDSVALANNNPINWNADFTFTGTTNLSLGTGAVAMAGSRTATITANTLTLAGPVSGTGTLTKRGTGMLNLTGTSAVGKVQIYGGGTLKVGAGGSLSSTSTLDITETSNLEVAGGFTSPSADQAHDGQKATVVVEGNGTLTSNGEWLMGRNMGSASLILKDDAVMTATGVLRLGRDNIRDNYVSLRNHAQATASSVVVFDSSYYGEGGTGSGSVLEVLDNAKLTAGSMTVANFLGNSASVHPRYGVGQVYQAGGSVTINGNISMGVEVSQAGDIITGTYNLNGGSLSCRQINNGSAAIPGVANLNVRGGTLAYNGTAAQPDFINLGAAGSCYVYEGVTIDDNGQVVTLNQPMLSPNAGQGVASISLAQPIGAVNAYPVTPEVLITGDGFGATAVARLNGSGQVDSIVVTCPGWGYSTVPTVQVFYQGVATAVPAAGTSLTANAFTGGLTKIGIGTLALAAANTYAGSTVVSNGTLLVNNVTGSGTSGSAVTVKPGATLGGSGTVAGAVLVEDAGNVAPGATVGTLTLGGGLTLETGATCTFELDASAYGANDKVLVTGDLILHGNKVRIAAPATLDTADYVLLTWTGDVTGAFNPAPEWVGTAPSPDTYEVVTDVANKQVVLRFVAVAPGLPMITFDGGVPTFDLTTSHSGSTYILVYKNELTDLDPWLPTRTDTPAPNGQAAGTGGPITLKDTDSPLPEHRFYRLLITTP